ncbi:MAG: metallophosphoesterase [Tannerella sp.]|jgi:predicted phosphodiesterase|nr:metallophosphoesterase [Tannerella sp.]
MKKKNYMNRKVLLTVFALALVGMIAWAQDYYRLYTGAGESVQISGNAIDSVKVESGSLKFYEGNAASYTQALSGIDSLAFESAPNGELPRFAVISDTHFGNNVGQGPQVKVPKALKNILGKDPVDALFVVGDMTNGGTEAEYDQLKVVFGDPQNVPAGLPVYYLMGNHDNYTDASAASIFRNKLGQELHQYIDIKGYPFITISQTGRSSTDYNTGALNFLSEKLADATVKYPGKPVFVFIHVPSQNTCYGSITWGTSVFFSILNSYPQAVVFSGHSHLSVADPRSIHQDKFTSVNDGSTTYSGNERGEVTIGTLPEGYENITEGLIVNVLPDSNVEIERWDTYRNEEILPRWLLEAPFNGSKFTYKDRDGLPPPAFADGAKPEVSDVSNYSCTVVYPQAIDNEVVRRYLIEILDGESAVSSYSQFSQFYLNSQMPSKLTAFFFGLPENKTLTARVTALDSYGNPSLPILSDPFETSSYTPDPNVQAPVADLLDAVFSEGGVATDVSAQQHLLTKGSTPPTTYLNETYNKWTASFTIDKTSYFKMDYQNNQVVKDAFVNAFSFETLYMANSTSATLAPLSAQHTGGAGIAARSGVIEFWIYLNGAYVTVGSGLTMELGRYYHVVTTYDKNTEKAIIYVDGNKVGELPAVGSFGFPALTNAQWIGIGADASTSANADFSLNGDVVIARMYGKALSHDEVSALYKNIVVPDAAAKWTVAGPGNMEWYKWGSSKTIGTSAANAPSLTDGPNDIQAWALAKEDHIKITSPLTTPATAYTLLWDIRVSDLSGYRPLLQTSESNADDGDIFLKANTIGSGSYSPEGTLVNDTWHRIVISVDAAEAKQVMFYVDGRYVLTKTLSSQTDITRYTLQDIFWIFLDDSNEDNALDCAGIALWEGVLSAKQILMLGAAGTPIQ